MQRAEEGSAIERIVLAHSGGLETSVAIPWLRQQYGADVITVSVDLGRVIRMKADAFAQSAVAIR